MGMRRIHLSGKNSICAKHSKNPNATKRVGGNLLPRDEQGRYFQKTHWNNIRIQWLATFEEKGFEPTGGKNKSNRIYAELRNQSTHREV
jgi:hypothetical protein